MMEKELKLEALDGGVKCTYGDEVLGRYSDAAQAVVFAEPWLRAVLLREDPALTINHSVTLARQLIWDAYTTWRMGVASDHESADAMVEWLSEASDRMAMDEAGDYFCVHGGTLKMLWGCEWAVVDNRIGAVRLPWKMVER